MKLSRVLQLPALLAASLLAPGLVNGEHTSNWAVLVSTSRFWFNYRHLANALSIYRTVKRLGIPDSQIILMLPDDMACNPRNAFPGTVYSNADRAVDLYGDNIEVDYRGYEVTVENFIRLLTDRVGDEMPRSKRLLTDDRSNILVYMTGHGGNEFLKFQDAEEIGAFDLADAFEQMWEKKRYHEILFMIDTCQANTMYSKLYSPNIIATGSSELDQSSYSHHADNDVGVAVIDRYTYYNLEFLETEVRDTSSKKTVGDLFDSYTYEKIHSHAGVRYDLFREGAEAARSRLLTDFFGNVQNVEVSGARNTTLDEELLSLSRTIAALHKKADEEEAAAKNATQPPQTQKPRQRIQVAKPLTDDNWWTKKLLGATACIPPLREVKLNTRPYAMRALDFSCDGELAVASDDSVHILVPEFPDPDRTVELSGHESEDEEETIWTQVAGRRGQYSQGSKHFLVSRPPVHPRVNEELFAAAGIPFPYGKRDPRSKGKTKRPHEETEADSSEEDETGSQASSNTPFGAGFGPITGSGSTMNHVISIRWSPTDMGVNRRPVLAVLGSRGALVIYGDRAATASLGMVKVNEGMLMRRNLDSWSILWGVGERLVVPGQQTEISEAIKSFAWAREIGPGQTLIAYITDQKEVAIISVQSVPKANIDNEDGTDDAWESDVVWHVHEVTRFRAEGPHPKPKITDPTWTPFGTAFALSFSPWLTSSDARSCLLSYVDRGYVGFRVVTLKNPWERLKIPNIRVSEHDVYGECVHNSSDSFFEFEDAIWTKRGSNGAETKVCRGLLNTGFHIKPIEVAIIGGPSYDIAPHATAACSTDHSDDSLRRPSTNPIVDLLIHPPDLTKNTAMPTYTLVRGSATHTNDDWFETNAPMPENPAATRPLPRWVTDLRRKLGKADTIDVLPQMFAKTSVEQDAQDDDKDDDDDDDEEDDEDDDAAADLPGKSEGAHAQRFRFYGLASSAGGGMSAALVMAQRTKGFERDNWHSRRSSLLFDSKPEAQRPRSEKDGRTARQEPQPFTRSLTTEGRMIEYMYGGGPGVPGVTIHDGADPGPEDAAAKQREALRDLFREAAESHRCGLDGRPLRRVDDGWECGRHAWSACGTSGLAIMVIGVARMCAVCGSRTLPLEMLAQKLPKEKRAELEALAAGDMCGRCGGKFLN
ncbi:hypothetical protein GQ53DRAFT_776930 [Thozetella sp. PMI_491]|nr:hypothetical protein GQ53DRAFT_776930 [Thozetella sp. PMI_491]